MTGSLLRGEFFVVCFHKNSYRATVTVLFRGVMWFSKQWRQKLMFTVLLLPSKFLVPIMRGRTITKTQKFHSSCPWLPSHPPLTQLSFVRIQQTLLHKAYCGILIRLMMYFLESGEFEGRPERRQCPANDKLKYANEELSDVWMEFVMIRTAIVSLSLSGTTRRSIARRITWLCSFSGDLSNEILSGSGSTGRMRRFCSFWAGRCRVLS